MSFSAEVKKEITNSIISSKEQASVFLYACIASIGIMKLSSSGPQIVLSYEGLSSAKFISELLKKYFNINCGIIIAHENLNTRKSYRLTIEGKDTITTLLNNLGFLETNFFMPSVPPKQYWNNTAVSALFIRGLYLSCGTITHPQKDYHAEFILTSDVMAMHIMKILNNSKLSAKVIPRNSCYVVYLKSGDDISLLLNILGAHSSLLDFENVRAMRDMRNNINRAANCETANFTKTYLAAQEQIDAITFIDSTLGINSLNQKLSDTACLRLANPDCSLNELAVLSGLSKSTLNHRMQKLKNIAVLLQEGDKNDVQRNND